MRFGCDEEKVLSAWGDFLFAEKGHYYFQIFLNIILTLLLFVVILKQQTWSLIRVGAV